MSPRYLQRDSRRTIGRLLFSSTPQPQFWSNCAAYWVAVDAAKGSVESRKVHIVHTIAVKEEDLD